MFRSIHRHEDGLNTVRWTVNTHIWYLYHKIRARSMQCKHRPYNSVCSKLLTRLECLFVTGAHCLRLQNIYLQCIQFSNIFFFSFGAIRFGNRNRFVWSREFEGNFIIIPKRKSDFVYFIYFLSPLFLCVTKEYLFELNRKYMCYDFVQWMIRKLWLDNNNNGKLVFKWL